MATTQQQISSEQRRRMIEEAAYFRAERRGFSGGDPVADWVDAEREVDVLLGNAEEASLLERLESQLDAANQKLQEAKQKITGMKSSVRSEWEDELERVGKLRDVLAAKLHKMRGQGGKVSQRARREAEKLREELSEALRRFGSRRK